MNLRLTLATAFALMFFGNSLSAFSSDDFPKAPALVRQLARASADMLVARGVVQFGNVSIPEFRDRIGSIDVQIVSGVVFGKSPDGTYREGAVNFRVGEKTPWSRRRLKRPTIFISSSTLVRFTRSAVGAHLLCTHEALDALGYGDSDYQISMGMHLALTLPTETSHGLLAYWSQRPRLPTMDDSAFPLPPSTLLASEGGASGSGKGGDYMVLRFRLYLIEAHARWLRQQNWSEDENTAEQIRFFSRLAWLRIESYPIDRKSGFCNSAQPLFESLPTPEGRTIRLHPSELFVIVDPLGRGSCDPYVDENFPALRRLVLDISGQ